MNIVLAQTNVDLKNFSRVQRKFNADLRKSKRELTRKKARAHFREMGLFSR